MSVSFNELITKCLVEKDISLLITFPSELVTAKEREYIAWIKEYTMRYRETPNIERMLAEFSTFIPARTEFPALDVYEQVLTAKRNLYARQFIMEHQEALREGDDPKDLILELASVLQKGGGELLSIRDVDRTTYLIQKGQIPWGIRSLQKAAGGFVKGDLAYVFGRPGSGKTTFAESRAHYWWEMGKRILFVSNENPASEIIGKIDAMIAGWNPLMRRTGIWSESAKAKLGAVSYVTEHADGDIIVPNRKIPTVSELSAVVKTVAPDVVIVDGVYLMRHEEVRGGGWEQAAAVSRELKQLALDSDTPILGVIQANREAEGKRATRGNVAHTDAYLQDADLMLAISAGDSDDDAVVELLKNRWGPQSGFLLGIDYDDMVVVEREAYVVEDEVEW